MLVQITQFNKIMTIELFRLLFKLTNDRIGIETRYSSYVAFALALLSRLKSNFTPVELLTLVPNLTLPLSAFRNQTARQLASCFNHISMIRISAFDFTLDKKICGKKSNK
jgi:hypothetical protein